MTPLLHSLLGFACLLLVAYALSERRRRIPWRGVVAGVLLQFLLAALLLKLPTFKAFSMGLNQGLLALEASTREGTRFVFGYLGGAALPFKELQPGASFVLAFQALPLVLVVSALSALLFHWRILPVFVKAFSWVLERIMGVGGAVGVATAANVFVGMVEAPLFVRPYLAKVSRGELFIIMSGGMAGIAGTVMALYAMILGPVIADALGHLMIASLVSAPAAILFSLVLVPPEGEPTGGRLDLPSTARNTMDAITQGTLEGVKLLINIVAMLLVLVALVHLANLILGALPPLGEQPLSLQRLFGYLMAPLVWMAGIPWEEARTAGALMGTKTVLNEFIAYLDLAKLPPEALSARSRLIMTYALCGFANFGSLGIMIGGMTTLCPERREEVLELGLKSLLAGTLATLSCGAVVGVLLG
ncbi:MAG: nucleoside:proton symporter [Betaproteobacteria bacterium]|nr:nucleoside:proton symporter [Betaproteobacteria bacterium]